MPAVYAQDPGPNAEPPVPSSHPWQRASCTTRVPSDSALLGFPKYSTKYFPTSNKESSLGTPESPLASKARSIFPSKGNAASCCGYSQPLETREQYPRNKRGPPPLHPPTAPPATALQKTANHHSRPPQERS